MNPIRPISSHHTEKDSNANDPEQTSRFSIGAKEKGSSKMQINEYKEETSSIGMNISQQPTPIQISNNMFNTIKSKQGIRYVMHSKQNASNNHQHLIQSKL
jgi:hypothetical protein